MEWREAMDDAKHAKDVVALENLLAEMQAEAKQLQENLADLFDTTQNFPATTDVTRKLIFIYKVCADIHKTIEHLDV